MNAPTSELSLQFNYSLSEEVDGENINVSL